MATPYQIGTANWRMRHGIAHLYGGSIYVRLYLVDVTFGFADQIAVWKSADDGATWTQISGGPNPGFGLSYTPGCGTVSGSIMYITYNRGDFILGVPQASSALCVARFDMATDTWLSDWVGPSINFSVWNQCGVRSDGSLVIAYLEHSIVLGTQPRKWKYVTCDSSGVFGTPADLNSATQTWAFATDEAMVGSIAIDAADTAHILYSRSLTGSSSADVQTMHRSLTLPGVLSSETVVTDFVTTGANSFNHGLTTVIATISGTESMVYSVGDNAGGGGSYPAVLYSPVTGTPAWTYAINANFTPHDQQWIARVGTTVYGTWPYSQIPGKYTGVKIGTVTSGAWSATEVTVNAGASAEEPWTWWTMNALGSTALGFVLEDWNDQTVWFMRYVIGSARVLNFIF